MTYKKFKVLSFCIHYIYKLRIPIKSNRMREAYVIRTSNASCILFNLFYYYLIN